MPILLICLFNYLNVNAYLKTFREFVVTIKSW